MSAALGKGGGLNNSHQMMQYLSPTQTWSLKDDHKGLLYGERYFLSLSCSAFYCNLSDIIKYLYAHLVKNVEKKALC